MLTTSMDHRWNRGTSSSGRPRIRTITRTGTAKVRLRTRSVRPSGANVSITSSTTRRTSTSSHAREELGPEGGRDEGAALAVLGFVHRDDRAPQQRAHRVRDDRRGEGLVVAQRREHRVVPEHVDHRHRGGALG